MTARLVLSALAVYIGLGLVTLRSTEDALVVSCRPPLTSVGRVVHTLAWPITAFAAHDLPSRC